MRKVILGVVAGVVLTASVIAAGLYFVYEKGVAIQAERQASIEQERGGAIRQFGTTCENATAKIGAFVYNELKQGLSTRSAEDESKDDRYSSLVASIEKHARYASYCGRTVRYPTGDRDFHSADKLVKLNSALRDVQTYLTSSKHENCDAGCRDLLLNYANNKLAELEKTLVTEPQWGKQQQ